MLRLLLYYLAAGILLLLITGVVPVNPPRVGGPPAPADMAGALEWVRGQLSLFPAGAPRWLDAAVQMLGALLLVLPMAFVYVRTRTRHKYDHSLVQTVIMLPIVVTAILVVVRDSLALAFSLAGIVAAVRFRNTLKESGDTVYIFGSIGIGFATGIHALAVATVLSIFFVVVELALWKFNFSAEFERTFARLCLPSGADLEMISSAIGEPGGPVAEPPPQPNPGTPAEDRTSLLRIYVDGVEQARPPVEAVLERDTKRWSLAHVQSSGDGASVLEYRVRTRKRVDLDTLREHLLKEAAPHVVAADEGVGGE
ncbi:MAG: DUF4956 domain-containing protein [Gemmatimonadales bacterium]